MNKEFINLRDQHVLGGIQSALEKIPVAATLLEASDEMPYNVLIAVTPEQVPVNIMYVPLPEDQFAEFRLLQFYTLVIPSVSAARKDDFLNLLNAINNQCPIGSFFINEKQELAYKYIFPVDRFEVPKELYMREIFSLFTSSLMNYRQPLLDLNEGAREPGDILKRIVED